MSLRSRTVFLDRDGVINRRRDDYVKLWDEVELLPGALEAVGRLSRSGREVIIVTNQSAIAQGLVSAQTVRQIHDRLARLIANHGGTVRAFLVCPHSRDEGCACRKPKPGLLLRAGDELGVDLEVSVLIGDQLSDVDAAGAAGCRAMLVCNDDSDVRSLELPDLVVVVPSLAAAAELICVS